MEKNNFPPLLEKEADEAMKPLVVDGPRMSDIVEPGESRLLADRIHEERTRGREILGVHLWTHSPRRFLHNPLLLPLLRTLREQRIPAALQATVTGLGGTVAEPGIESTGEALDHLGRLLDSGLITPDRICLRIDPLQSWQEGSRTLTNTDRMDGILADARKLGILRVRVSLIAFDRYRIKILPRTRYRKLKSLPLDRREIGKRLRDWIRKGLDVRTCACDLLAEEVPPGACFDFAWITGLPLEEPAKPVAARNGCLCLVPERMLLWKIPRRSICTGGCLACYAQEHRW